MSNSPNSLQLPAAPPFPKDPPLALLFKAIYRLSGRSKSLDAFLTPMLKYRYYLPVVAAEKVIPAFSETRLSIVDLPRGEWATPLVDTLSLLKAAVGFQAKRVLEIGSYKGATARLIAENTPESTHIWPLDQEPEHGSAYRDTPLEARIHKIVGSVSLPLLKEYGPFDFIFVDADHDYKSVWDHSMCAFELLSPGGVIFWHDYQHRGCLHGMGGVPEALNAVRNTGRPIYSIEGTMLCIYSEYPGWETSRLSSAGVEDESDPWKSSKLCGL